MFIRVLAIWVACGFWLYSIHTTEPAMSPAVQAQVLSAQEMHMVQTHLRCVAPVIEGRSLRTLSSADYAASRDYVMAPARADGQVVGSCGAIVLAAASR
jgi:hypothetical protein